MLIVVLLVLLLAVSCTDDGLGSVREEDSRKCSLAVEFDSGAPALRPCWSAPDHPYAVDLRHGDPLVLGVIERGSGSWRDVDELYYDQGWAFQYWRVGDGPAKASDFYAGGARSAVLPVGTLVVRLLVPPGFDVARARVSLGDAGYVTEWVRAVSESLVGIDRYLSLGDYYVSHPLNSTGETATLQRFGYTYTVVDP